MSVSELRLLRTYHHVITYSLTPHSLTRSECEGPPASCSHSPAAPQSSACTFRNRISVATPSIIPHFAKHHDQRSFLPTAKGAVGWGWLTISAPVWQKAGWAGYPATESPPSWCSQDAPEAPFAETCRMFSHTHFPCLEHKKQFSLVTQIPPFSA